MVLRQQINVLRRANPKRLRFVSIDRLILGGVCRLFPKLYGALAIVRPDTVIRWHRGGFRSLAMEIEAPLRTTGRDGRNTPAYPPDELRQSVVGSTEDPWRASEAHGGVWRTPSASRVAVVHELLQRNAHSLVIEQRCTELARCRNSWTHYLPSDPGRIAPPICPDLICGRHRSRLEEITRCPCRSGWRLKENRAMLLKFMVT